MTTPDTREVINPGDISVVTRSPGIWYVQVCYGLYVSIMTLSGITTIDFHGDSGASDTSEKTYVRDNERVVFRVNRSRQRVTVDS